MDRFDPVSLSGWQHHPIPGCPFPLPLPAADFLPPAGDEGPSWERYWSHLPRGQKPHRNFLFLLKKEFSPVLFSGYSGLFDQLSFSGRNAGIKPVSAHPFSQQKIGFQGSLRRSDTDQVFTPGHFPDFIDRNISRSRDSVVVFFFEGYEKTILMIHIFIAESSAIADEISIHLLIVPAADAAEGTISFAGDDVAADGAIVTHGRGIGEIPFSGIMLFEGFVGKYAGRADLDQISAEFIFEYARFVPAKIDIIVRGEDSEIFPSGVVVIESYTPVALDAAVHFMIDERAQILIVMGSFVEPVAPVCMSGHDRHVLKVTFSSLIAYGAVMGVIDHQSFDIGGPEIARFRGFQRDSHIFSYGFHACHDQFSFFILFIFVADDSTLPAGAHRTHGGMPAEIGEIHFERKASLQYIGVCSHLICLTINVDRYFHDFQGHFCW